MKKGNGKTGKGNCLKKLLCVVLCAVIALSNFSVEALAAGTKKAHLKGLNISWDLENNKTVGFQAYQPGIGYWDMGTVTMKNYKVENLKGKGKKKLTFTIIFNFNGQLSASEVDEIYYTSYENYDGMAAGYYCSVVDYYTGKCLENENNKGVKATASVKEGDENYSYGTNGVFISYPKYWKAKVKVVYPADYDGLCIIAGGSTLKFLTDYYETEDFFNGNIKLGKANYISDINNKVCHAMRVK